MTGHFLFLGTGGSMGVPVIGCKCSVCKSKNPHNKRLRPSGLLTLKDKTFIVDAGPDLREQALKYHIDKLDGVIFTHAHHDHSAGIDELRVFTFINSGPLPCLMSAETYEDLRTRFSYIFTEKLPEQLISRMAVQVTENKRGRTSFCGIDINYLSFEQANMQVTGYRFGSLAYVSDIKHYPETIFEDLKGIDTLILSALRFTPSALHLTVDEAIDFSKRTGARNTWLTHISHDLDHDKTNAYLPDGIKLAYDGLKITIE